MIDTLKLSNRLKAAHMPAEQADALSDAVAESLKESYVTREFLDWWLTALESRFDTRLAALGTRLIAWVVGTVGLAAIIDHWWR